WGLLLLGEPNLRPRRGRPVYGRGHGDRAVGLGSVVRDRGGSLARWLVVAAYVPAVRQVRVAQDLVPLRALGTTTIRARAVVLARLLGPRRRLPWLAAFSSA